MLLDLTILDWVLFAVLATLAFVGLFRGLSGELGSLAGLAAALVAGFLLYGAAWKCAEITGLVAHGWGTAGAVVIDFCFGLVAFGLVRWLVSKFVSCCLGRVTNAFFGLLGGLFKGVVLVGLLTGIGIVRPGAYSTGCLAAHSTVIRLIAGWADAYWAGVSR